MTAQPVVAIEIKNSGIVVLVGESDPDGGVVITGAGRSEVPILRDGFCDFDAGVANVISVLQMAEESGHVSIGRVHVVFPDTDSVFPVFCLTEIFRRLDIEIAGAARASFCSAVAGEALQTSRSIRGSVPVTANSEYAAAAGMILWTYAPELE